jgi:hypothetical protein
LDAGSLTRVRPTSQIAPAGLVGVEVDARASRRHSQGA